MSIKTHDVTGVYDVLVMYPDELRYRKLIRHPFQCFADEVIVTSGKDVTVVTVGHAVDDLTKIDAVRDRTHGKMQSIIDVHLSQSA